MTCDVGGIILCGGRSQRFGFPKHRLLLNGETLLHRTMRIVSEVTAPIVLVAATEEDMTPFRIGASTIVVRDSIPHDGPLRALVSGLEALLDRCPAAFVAACDLPFLRVQFVQGMINRLGQHAIAVPRTDGILHPLAGVYRIEVASTAKRLIIDSPRAGPKHLCNSCRTRFVEKEELTTFDPDLLSLTDVDTPQDWDRARKRTLDR